MRRYLERIQRRSRCGAVAFIRAEVESQESSTAGEDVDAFFNYLLRQNDLLFRLDSRQWLFVVCIGPIQPQDFLHRAEEEWKKVNRNRPFSPVPRFHLQLDGTWNVDRDEDVLLAQFSEMFPQQGDENPSETSRE